MKQKIKPCESGSKTMHGKLFSREEADPEETVPARFLQRWKPKADAPGGRVANARVILQGFRHRDVLTQELATEAPTLSRIGRHLIYVYAVHKGWKMFAADVKSAFMQADSIDDSTRIYINPSADIRRRLERLMGLKPHEILKATKPAFGDVRAPRQWNTTADGAMVQELRFLWHPLDRCVYMSLREAVNEDEEFCCVHMGQGVFSVDGVLGLHVDDYLGAGEGVHGPHDLEGDYDGAFLTFRDRLCGLSRRFRFGSWDFGPIIKFCGADVEQSVGYDVITISMQKYVKKILPLSIEKSRKTMAEDPCAEKEHRNLRALVGALAWPSNQCLPQISASVSILQAHVSKPQVKDMNDANRVLRFAKMVAQEYKLKIHRHAARMSEVRFSVYTDAAWAVRPDGSSQGGFLIFACSEEEMMSGNPMNLTIVDWHSRKLTRMCRSSMSAEAQSAAGAVDELEWCKVFWSLMVNPMLAIEDDNTMKFCGSSFLLTDAKSLFNASRSITSGMHLSERRTAIEVAIVAERVKAMGGEWRWMNSHQQLADGLTKPSARDRFAEVLQRGNHQLRFDPNFVAAKKVSHKEKTEQERQLQEASEAVFGVGEIVVQEEKDEKICKLLGCNKVIDGGRDGNKFCSRRHFYLHQHRQGERSDSWRDAATKAMAILALENVPGAEAREEETNGFSKSEICIAVLVIIVFGVGVTRVVQLFVHSLKSVFGLTRIERDPEPNANFENVRAPRNDQVFVDEQVSVNNAVPVEIFVPENSAVSAENFFHAAMEIPAETFARPSHVDAAVSFPSEDRWRLSYAAAGREPNQQNWKKLSDEVSGGQHGSKLRDWWYENSSISGRMRRYYEKNKMEKQVSENMMLNWHRICNVSDLNYMRGNIQAQLDAQKDRDRERQINVAQQIREGRKHDRVVQSPLTPQPGTNRFQVLPENQWGAWQHRSTAEESFVAGTYWLTKLQDWTQNYTGEVYQAMVTLEGQEEFSSTAGPIRLHHQDEHGSFVTYEFLRRKVFKQWAIDKGLLRGLLRHVWQPSLDEPMAIGDFGAGGGHYSKWLNETGLVEAFAFDGTHQAAELTDGLVQEVNLVQEMRLWRSFDWILCLEVGEHVPKQYAPTLLANLKRHSSKGLVMSWSDDWEGIGHVNCLSRNEFVAFVQESTGFVLDEDATEVVRQGCEIDYIARTLAVFRAPR
eukprot:s692_g16.t1